MKPIFFVGFGGLLGAICRYKLGGVILHQSENWRFPLGTFVINMLGCLVLGLIMGVLERRQVLEPQLSLFLITGFLGSFTTFSAFSYETLFLMRRGDFPTAILNIFLSVVFCLTAVWFGTRIGRTAVDVFQGK